MYSNAGKSRRKSPRYKAWKEAAQWDVKLQYSGGISDQDVMVQVALHQPDNRKRDLDNLAKSVIDVLTGTVLVDDDQIKLLCMWWADNKNGGQAVVMVDPIGCAVAQSFLASHAARFDKLEAA